VSPLRHRPPQKQQGGAGDDFVETSLQASALSATGKKQTPSTPSTASGQLRQPVATSNANAPASILYRTLLPDTDNITVQLMGNQWPVFETQENGEGSAFVMKLVKFILLTFALIALVHSVVSRYFDDRDQSLTMAQIVKFDGDNIVRDCVVFFVVGRMWRQCGVDHMAFVGTALLANVYFESQNYMGFLQHSLTLYEMNCTWPWELWVFVSVLIPAVAVMVAAHVVRAYRTRVLVMKLIELALCVLFFMAPMMSSNYFHLHHWYGGWLLGMHANFDTWWSRFAMAWCFGMYVNGIAVYGRDPVLTCEYAYFLTMDLRCPYVSCYLEALQHPENATDVVEMIPVDWRNCSSTDYIP